MIFIPPFIWTNGMGWEEQVDTELHPPHQSAPTNYAHYSPNTKHTRQSSVGPLHEKAQLGTNCHSP